MAGVAIPSGDEGQEGTRVRRELGDQGVPVLLHKVVRQVTRLRRLRHPEENGQRFPIVEFIRRHNGQGRLNDGGSPGRGPG